MASKFVVMYDNEICEGVFDTLTDAEEYILSIAEEAVYHDFLEAIMCGHVVFWRPGKEIQYEYDTPEEWFDQWNLEDLEDVWTDTGLVPRQTAYSAMLSHFAEYDWIFEAPYYG